MMQPQEGAARSHSTQSQRVSQRHLAEALLLTSSLMPEDQVEAKLKMAEKALETFK